MAKPVGYYCGANLFDELIEKYGSQLEGFTKQQKLFLIINVAYDLCASLEGGAEDLANPEIQGVINRLRHEISIGDKESFLICLANQVREERQAPVKINV